MCSMYTWRGWGGGGQAVSNSPVNSVAKQTSTQGTRCQGGSWTCRFGEERGHFKELEFDPEPLGSVEKRGEDSVIGRQTAEAEV